ncbi:unnamed protein product [Microthlaspi erraticum]|uniref:Uncharacterized protein n=1 Tax=Microthlaspi erraticum TaxID=1685480 RepID=A0A6D2J0I9_9BRAS|nr:unnamed protein product [Microthlaspi erraticum]
MPLFSARSGVMKQFDAPESNKTWDSKPPTNKTSDRLEIPLQSLTPLICRLWANSALKVRRTNPLHVPHHIQIRTHPPKPAALCCTSATGGTPGAPVEPLAENEPITASANPPLSHQDPEPEHHPNPEQPPLPNQHSHPHWPHSPWIPTGSPTQSPHSAPHSLPNPPKSTISAPASPRPLAPRPLAPQPLATQSISLMEPKRAH